MNARGGARRRGRMAAKNCADREAAYVARMVLAIVQEIRRSHDPDDLAHRRQLAMQQLADRHPTELAQLMLNLDVLEAAS